MVLKYRRRPLRRRLFKKRKTFRRKAMSSVSALSRKVNYLSRKVANAKDTIHTYRTVDSTAISAPFFYYNICRYNSLLNSSPTGGPVWGADDQDTDNLNRIFHKSTAIQWKLEANNEYANTQFTMFCVSLKKIARSLYDDTGTLNLVADQHYRLFNGMAYLNKGIFNIHYFRRFMLGNNNVALNTSTANANNELSIIRSGYIKLKPRKWIDLKGMIDFEGDIEDVNIDPDPTRQYFLILFNDNQSADLENPRIQLNQLTTFIKTQ